MPTIEEKMHAIAEELNELNANGMVKSFSGNEKGYAKILQIKPGCSIWAHHTLDDQLIIDLMVTESVRQRYPDIVKETTDKFKAFFKHKTIAVEWQHSIDEKTKAKKYYVNITERPIKKTLQIMQQLKTHMKKP